jgi:hypothetical protein
VTNWAESTAYSSTVISNAISAVLLDVDFYERAEHDPGLTFQAAAVVAIASALAGVGSAFALEIDDVSVVAAILGGMAAGVVGWLLWSLASYVIGTTIFGGTATYGSMLRVIGFAFTPLALGVIPWLGFPAAVWMLVAAVIAFREGLDLPLWKAVGTMAIGWGLWLSTTIVLNLLLDWNLNARWPFPS